jgi:hypothetical protein
MLPHRNKAWLCVLTAAGLLTGLALVSPAGAAPVKPTKKAAVSPFETQIVELHKIKVLLERADRDYKGHRAAAVKAIGAAIHTLHPGKHHKHPKVKGGNETQALSDAQLREAVKGLTEVEKQLASVRGEVAAKAAVEVAKAIKQLEIALEVR